MTAKQRSILMCYGKTAYTPGSYLERGFKKAGVAVDVITDHVDFAAMDPSKYVAVLFVESPSLPPVTVKNRDQVNVPVLFWIHHGENRLQENLHLCSIYRPDRILMSHSLHLSPQLPAPVHFFPFGVDPEIFYSERPYSERKYDITFAGALGPKYYSNRRESLQLIEDHFQDRAVMALRKRAYLQELAMLYGNSKIVFNQTADELKTFNMRIFEGMGCGALVFTDPVPEQDRLFQPGKHYVVYQSQKDLIKKLEYFLKHPEKAAKIAATGQKYVLQSHQYVHRAKRILTLIQTIRSG